MDLKDAIGPALMIVVTMIWWGTIISRKQNHTEVSGSEMTFATVVGVFSTIFLIRFALIVFT